jgi:hypothetical protein
MADTDFILWKMRPSEIFLIRCQRCDHLAQLTQGSIRYRVGPEGTIRMVEERCRCSNCGTKGDVRVTVGPPVPGMGYPVSAPLGRR